MEDTGGLMSLLQHPGYAWLAAAVVLMLVEAFGVPGTGLFFAGLGALVAGLCVLSGVVAEDNHTLQFIVFFVFSLIWAALLWKPLQKFRVGSKKHGEYHNIVGSTAYVGGAGLHRKTGGEVTWSGTIMKAELSKNAGVDSVEAGAQVTIVEVTGATLVVVPKA